ncbi:MAG: hypothetical protein PHV49_04400, partial [Alistipes sp.]|nr:hypothetical protein [Alistipes sp.]
MVRDGRRSVWLLNLCIALALALLVNFSFFITGSDMRGHRPPSLLEVAPWHITFQVLYAGLLAFVLVSLNTVQRFSLGRKILFS